MQVCLTVGVECTTWLLARRTTAADFYFFIGAAGERIRDDSQRVTLIFVKFEGFWPLLPTCSPLRFSGEHEFQKPLILLVGAAGFEPTTPSPPDWCANRAALRSDDGATIVTGHFCRNIRSPSP